MFRLKPFKPSRLARLSRITRVRQAVDAAEIAQNRFDWATGLYVDSAVSGCVTADRHLSAVLSDIRPLTIPDDLLRGGRLQGWAGSETRKAEPRETDSDERRA